MKWLVFDFGPNYGDNFRGFLFLKSLKKKFPDVRLTCWMSPELHSRFAGFLPYLSFIEEFLIRDRTPRDTYAFNFKILQAVLGQAKRFSLDNFPGGLGPDGKYYEKIIPNSEPWFTCKLLLGGDLSGPDAMNQGEFLAAILNLSDDQLSLAAPLLGERKDLADYIAVGLCRPTKEDRKQPTPAKVAQIWTTILRWEVEVYVLDYQDWYPLPQSKRIRDARMKSFPEKVPILNHARLFIGLDGGLNHFAAACGCPTCSFFGEAEGDQFGSRVGPYPRRTVFGEHQMFTRFEVFLSGLEKKLADLAYG